MLVVAVALELEHAVDEVLQHARAGDRPVLRHVTDEDGRHARLLRDAEQTARGLAHLADRARRRAERRRVQRLHRVDHADVGALAVERRADCVELRLREDLDRLRTAETGSAQRHLRGRLLPRDEQRPPPGTRDRPERGQQQRRLADAGLAADEHERRGHETAAEHAIELGDPGRDALRLVGRDVADGRRVTSACALAAPVSEPWSSSTSVPNALQPGHLPSQRPDVVPHSEHVNWTVTLATEPV